MSTAAKRPMRQLAGAIASQWVALGIGLAACFLVLLATKQLGAEVRVFCALGAIVVITLWLATDTFRRDGVVFAASSTLALLPIAALECGWVEIEGQGSALLIETFCLAVLFVSHVQRLGGEAIAAARPILAAMPGFAARTGVSIGTLRACAIMVGLLFLPAAVLAATGQVPDAAAISGLLRSW